MMTESGQVWQDLQPLWPPVYRAAA